MTYRQFKMSVSHAKVGLYLLYFILFEIFQLWILLMLQKVTYLREPIVSKALERKLCEWTIVNTLEALDSKFILTKALTKL